MANMAAILIANAVGIALMAVLLLNAKKTGHHKFPDVKLFYAMVLLTLYQCIMEPITFLIDGGSFFGARPLIYITNCSLFIVNILFAALWPAYVDFKLFEDMNRLKRKMPLLAVPAIVVVILSILSCFLPIVFTVTPQNVYRRASFNIFPYLISYFYLAYGVVLGIRNRRKVHKYMFMPVMVFIIPVAIGSVLQLLFYGISVLWVSVAVAMVSIYVNVQNESSNIDELSGLYSRRYLNHYLEAKCRRAGRDGTLAGIMLDIDSFKSINDEYGHSAGDAAIRTLGGLLRSAVPYGDFVARYAGDEFMIIKDIDSADEMAEVIDNIRRATERYNVSGASPYVLRVSAGSAVYHPGSDSTDDFLKRMDEAMYADKQSRRGAVGQTM